MAHLTKIYPAYQNIPWNIIKTHWQMMTEGNAGIAQEDAFNAVVNLSCNGAKDNEAV